MKHKLMATLVVGLLAAPIVAQATLVTYEFTVISLGGSLVGTSATGYFSYDDSIVPAGGGFVDQNGALVDLSFEWNSIAYDETTANTGFLLFTDTGVLDLILVCSTFEEIGCRSTSGEDTWFFFAGGYADFSYGTLQDYGVQHGSISLSLIPSVPEPGTLLQKLHDDVIGVGPGKSLANKVANAQMYYSVPDVQATCAMLTAFIHEVRAQRGKKMKPKARADELIADAQAIMDAIGCD